MVSKVAVTMTLKAWELRVAIFPIKAQVWDTDNIFVSLYTSTRIMVSCIEGLEKEFHGEC